MTCPDRRHGLRSDVERASAGTVARGTMIRGAQMLLGQTLMDLMKLRPHCQGDQFRDGIDSDFSHQSKTAILDGSYGHSQLSRDLPVLVSFNDQIQNFQLFGSGLLDLKGRLTASFKGRPLRNTAPDR